MEAENSAVTVKDLRGVSCPMNLVHTKVELAKIAAGALLRIILDNGPPIKNVPGSLAEEGHEIVRQEQNPDSSWTVLIRKGA